MARYYLLYANQQGTYPPRPEDADQVAYVGANPPSDAQEADPQEGDHWAADYFGAAPFITEALHKGAELTEVRLPTDPGEAHHGTLGRMWDRIAGRP